MAEITQRFDVGVVCAEHLFGPKMQRFVALLISAGMLATVSSLIMAGSRVTKTIGEDFKALGFLAQQTTFGNPQRAVILQIAIATALLLTSRFDEVLTYIGFTLTVFTVMSVAGVFVIRRRFPNAPGYRSWGHPFTTLLFLAFNVGMMYFLLTEKTRESLAGLATLGVGVCFYFFIRREAHREIH